MTRTVRTAIFILFAALAGLSVYYALQIKFSFDFEQFFPDGDDDLEFFREFVNEFETDDNFMLIGVRRENGVFEQQFLEQFHELSLKTRELPHVVESQSLTKFSYPIKTPFAVTTIPAIHIDQPDRYEKDKERILADKRFVHNFISEDATSLVIVLKMINSIQLDQAKEFMAALETEIAKYDFEEHHFLGRPYFQRELVKMQKREITISAVVSGILVTIIMFLIFRKPIGIGVAIVSIGLGMLLFVGFLGGFGREVNAMAALYPVLMIIVGTSDVIHIMSKYIDELKRGKPKKEAIRITIREIGLATLLTSVTTAIGFASLITSRIAPIRDFGWNAAIGVLIAYITVVLFTTALLSLFRADQIIKFGKGQKFWDTLMERWYQFTRDYSRGIAISAVALLLLSFYGISLITTNYSIIRNLPNGEKITEDFTYFDRELTSFRPMEFAVTAKNGYQATDYEVLREIEKVEDYLNAIPAVQGVVSITAIYKTINQMFNNNRVEAYKMPDDKLKFDRYQRYAEQIPKLNVDVLVSEDKSKARITSRIRDIGADTIKNVGMRIDQWILNNTDTTVVNVSRTGTGLIIDKNAEYVRRNLLQGLGMAMVIVSLLMVLLFRNWRMLVISLIPNIFPLILCGALLGFVGIELEAGVSIVFAVIFGIAVDDTIHFLSKYKLAKDKGYSVEEALKITFHETGKAICLTTIILFFGFLVMLFSIHPPSVTIGLLISLTLFSALISDLMLIPLLIRWFMPGDETSVQENEETGEQVIEVTS